jgi:hypothetical protein
MTAACMGMTRSSEQSIEQGAIAADFGARSGDTALHAGERVILLVPTTPSLTRQQEPVSVCPAEL